MLNANEEKYLFSLYDERHELNDYLKAHEENVPPSVYVSIKNSIKDLEIIINRMVMAGGEKKLLL